MNKESYLKSKEKELKVLKKEHIIYIEKAINCINNEDYKMALNILFAAKHNNQHSIFDYYIGKTYYLMGNYEYSKIYFDKYDKIGGILLLECKIYLLLIILNSNNKHTPYINNLEDIYKIIAYNNEQDDNRFNDINYLFSLTDNDNTKIYNLINSKTED